MSSATRQIPPSEWDRHKDTIVGLSWQYEMQLKRWNVRKNATRKEWLQYFSNSEHRSIPTSIDASGPTLPPIIRSKSTASKKRASRWVSGGLVEPSTSQDPGSALPRSVAQPIAASSSDEILALEGGIQHDIQGLFTNVANALDGLGSVPMYTDPLFNSMVTTYESHTGSSQALFDAMGGPAQFLDLNPTSFPALPSPTPPDFHSPPGQDCSVGFFFPSLGIPAENNLTFFSLLRGINFKQELPSAQLEHILRSKGIVLDKAAAHTIFGGFALRYVAGILSSKDQSIVRKTPNLRHFLRKLSSQVPGKSSALTTDDQAFETNFARALLFSVLNGFAGLDDVPMENILRFLNRFVVNKILLDILERCPRHVSRTLADNIFRAAIEATDADVVKLLLDRKLVDAKETVCFQGRMKSNPIQRASELRSLRLMQALIGADADVNKFYVNGFTEEGDGSALDSLMKGMQNHLSSDSSTVPRESFEAFNILVAAGGRVHPKLMILDHLGRTVEFDFLISQNVPSESHQGFFQGQNGYPHPSCSLITKVAEQFDDRRASTLVRNVMDLCHESSCNKCVVEYSDQLRSTVLKAAETGKIDLVQLLLKEADLESELPRIFIAAIKSQNHNLIDFILSKAPDLDPPAIATHRWCAHPNFMSTPIAEAVRDHDDIAQMLLEAGSLTNPLFPLHNTQSPLDMALRQSNAQMVRDLIAAGDHISQIQGSDISTKEHRAIVFDLAHEYPGLRVGLLHTFVRSRIELDTLDLKEILKTWVFSMSDLDYYLEKAVDFGYADLVEYLLDMGANPLNQHVLRAAIHDRPDILRQLFQKAKLRQTMPKCIGACILASIMDHGAGNAEALDELIRTEAINFARLELLYDDRMAADVYEKYKRIRFTPLGLAIQGVDGIFDTNMIAMEKFIDAGADPDGIAKCNERWTKGSPLMTALMVAIETGREDAVNMLLHYGADVNARPRIRTTRTALQYAAELGNMDMVRLLLSRGADANSSAPSRGGATALQFASMSGNCNMVAHLLDHGAQLDALPSRIDGMWPLEGAATNGRLDMIRYLWELKMRADMAGMPYGIFSDRQCLRAMSFAGRNGHIGCRDFVSELSGISVDRLQTDEYGAPWIAY
ncbi:hypothetical protein LA080_000774 [Diaporthe eres]|nr:hypothetical protein LA080_000774 [Diaporthe eres]